MGRLLVLRRYLHLAGVELLLAQVLPQSVLVAALLLPCKLAQGVMPDGAVVPGHAQRAPALTGHAGEALPPGKVVDGDQVEADALPPERRLLLPQDGGGWGGKTSGEGE